MSDTSGHQRVDAVNRQPLANPFYSLLIVVGVAFVLTACGYTVATARGLQAAHGTPPGSSGAWFVEWMDRHGQRAIVVELGLLAAATLAAMATDTYWHRRSDVPRGSFERRTPVAPSASADAQRADPGAGSDRPPNK